MGCHCGSKDQLVSDLQTEDAIMMHETALGYSGLSASTTMNIIKVFSRKGKLRQKKLVDVLMALELPWGQLDARDGPMFSFYKLLTESKVYTVKKLSILGTLLGAGTSDKKAAILFSLYEDRSFRTVGSMEIGLMMRNAFHISFFAVPKYAELVMTTMRDLSGLKKLEKYTNRLRRRQKIILEIVKRGVLQGKDSITIDKFVKNLCKNCEFVLNSHSLRWFTAALKEVDGKPIMETNEGEPLDGSAAGEPGQISAEGSDEGEGEGEGEGEIEGGIEGGDEDLDDEGGDDASP